MQTFLRILLPVLLVVSIPNGMAAEAPAAVVAELTRISDAWDKAIVSKDEAAIAANMAEDFRQIDSRGHYETKASFIASVMDPEFSMAPYQVEEFEIRLYGDVALLSGRIQLSGTYGGEAWRSDFRYIDVYHRLNGQWKIVSVQTTRVQSD